MRITLQALQDRIKGPHPTAQTKVLNVLLKGAQVYISGDEASEDNDINEDDDRLSGDQVQDELRGMELGIGDFDAL